MSEYTVSQMVIPRGVGAEGWGDFVDVCDLRNEIEESFVGTRELAVSPEEMLPHWLDPKTITEAWLARIDGRLVGRGMFIHHPEDSIASVLVQVRPESRRRGIGATLYEIVREHAEAAGKDVFQTSFYSLPDEPGPRIFPPAEAGSVAADAPGSRFAVQRGFVVQLILRYSRLDLPIETEVFERHLREAEAAAGVDYRVVRWEGHTPERWQDAMALLRSKMETDAPHGDIETGDAPWDAQRIRDMDDLDERSGRLMLVAAVEHVPTGDLVAYTELGLPREGDRPVTQRDTIVLAAHRGHRLGMLLKADNILTLEASRPGHPSITTINAEGNEFMLAVNEAVGFVPIAQSSIWKRVVG